MKKGFSDDKSFLFGVGLIGTVLFIVICAFYCVKDRKSEELESAKASILQDFKLNLTETSEKQ